MVEVRFVRKQESGDGIPMGNIYLPIIPREGDYVTWDAKVHKVISVDFRIHQAIYAGVVVWVD